MRMMNNYRKTWMKKDSFLAELNDEEFGFSKGCCLFHDQDELKEFIDVDDDEDIKS